MKKNIMKISAIFATALMAASAAGMSVSANPAETAKALKGTRTVKTASKSVKKAKGGNSVISEETAEASMSLIADPTNAKPGDEINVDLVMNTGNRCGSYDLAVEYDSRLEFVGVSGVQASCEFEENGRKFVSLVNYTLNGSTYADGESTAKLTFRVPDGAENDNYAVKIHQITSFTNDLIEDDFEEYTTNDAVIKVTGGVEKKVTGIRLGNVVGVAGDDAVVQVIPTSGNSCSGYDMLIEYDSRLYIDMADVAGANAFDIFEQDGRCYVSVVGFSSDVFNDGEPMAALNFHIPEDATAADTYEVKVAKVTDFATAYASIDNYQTQDASISVISADAGRENDKVSQLKTFRKMVNGALMRTQVGYRGDANADGKANVRDAAAIANGLAKKAEFDEVSEFFGDVNDDGHLNVRDAAAIAKYVSKGSKAW